MNTVWRAIDQALQTLLRQWALQMLQTRAGQLAGLIRQIEADMADDSAEHQTLLLELRRVNARLAAARQHQRHPRGTAW